MATGKGGPHARGSQAVAEASGTEGEVVVVEPPSDPKADPTCSNCGSKDVVVSVVDDPSASDAHFCATCRPANRR